MRLGPERILLVTGNADVLGTLRATLSTTYTTVDATGVSQARGLLAPAVDLVIVDLALPQDEVLALCRELRAQNGEVELPIVALVDGLDEAGVKAAVAAGANDFLRLPILAAVASARVAGLLRAARLHRELTQRHQDLEVLLELTRRFASTLDGERILYDLVVRLSEALGLSRCSLIMVDPEGQRGLVVAASNDPDVRDLEIDLANYPEIELASTARGPLVIEHAQEDPRLSVKHQLLREQGVGSLAIFPLILEGRLLGVLFLRAAEHEGRFTEREIGFVDTVSHATVVALRNARLFASMRDESKRALVQRIRAERQLEELKRFQDLYEHVSEGILLVDDAGLIEGANPSARKMLVAVGDPEGRELAGLAENEEDRRRLSELASRRAVRAESVLEIAVPGSPRPRILSVAASKLADGGAVISFRDVTESRRVEEALRKTSGFLENLIESSADGIVAADMSGTVVLWNRAAERLVGWSREEAIGKLNLTRIYPDGQAFDIMKMLRSDLSGGVGRLENWRSELVSRTDERIPISMSAAILYEDGEEVATMGIFTDLRERLRIEEKLMRAQDRLQRTEKQAVIAELAGTAAHELNQPLTSVMGYAEILRRRILPDDPSYRAVDIIYRESERMAEIVRKIGRITRYETKEYLGSTRIVDLDRSVEED